MIHEPTNFDMRKAIESKDKRIHCGHGEFFWNMARSVEVGDIIACEVCCQYFIKARDLPWLIKSRESEEHAAYGINFEFPERENHLLDRNFFYKISIRVT